MDEILEILAKDARTTPKELAQLTGQTLASVKKKIKKFEDDGTIIKYKTVINTELARDTKKFVRALIEVSVSPQKDEGFDYIAERIYQFEEVISCYLVSGAYDLLLVVEGEDIHTVSNFISSKLSPMAHVRSTSTHFLLKTFKEDGHIFQKNLKGKRLNISY